MVIAVRRAVIFDLDDTLVDTRPLRSLRDRREWTAAVAALPKTEVFSDVPELLRELAARSIAWAVVTTSVSYYAEALLRYHGLGTPPLVAFHDAPRKPSPAPVETALVRLGIDASAAIGVGDHENDRIAYHEAGALAVAAGWSPVVQHGGWDRVAAVPLDILKYL